jgi:fructoselysine-6-P-deglycase FrlB-like protein
MWLASLQARNPPCEVVCVPSGLLARGAFAWRDGDLFLAISSSGEFRDLVEGVREHRTPSSYVAITGERDSFVGRHAAASASFSLPPNRAVTHTQDFCCATACVLAVWAELSADVALREALLAAPDACAASVQAIPDWAEESFPNLQTPPVAVAFGHGPAWAAALEAALLLKEIALVPCEGLETREAATSARTALTSGHLVISLPSRLDPYMEESERICREAGASVIRAPAPTNGDPRLAALTCFAAAAATSVELALRRGLDIERPAWVDAYYGTARSHA